MPLDKEKQLRIKKLAEKDTLDFLPKEHAEHIMDIGQEGGHRPYALQSTLLNAPLETDLSQVDIGLVGIPFDLGVTNRTGARLGPKQMRDMSYVALNGPPIHHVSKIAPFLNHRVRDIGDMPFNNHFSLDEGIKEIEEYYNHLMASNVIPITAGGDHSITYPILKALGKDEPVALIHFDAHADTAGPIGGSKFHHGGPFLNAALAGVLDPEKTIQIGIRGPACALWGFSYESGMRVIHIEEFNKMGVDAVIAEARKIIGDTPTYITMDVDGIDPAYTPGTGTPEVGGLTPLDVQQVIRGMQGANLIGGDVVEVSPPFDSSGNTAMVAAKMMWEILCVVSDSRKTITP